MNRQEMSRRRSKYGTHITHCALQIQSSDLYRITSKFMFPEQKPTRNHYWLCRNTMMVLHHIYHKGAQCRPRQRLLRRQRRKEDYLAARRRKRKIIISAMRTLFTENTRRRMEGRGRSGHCGTVNGVKTKKRMYSGFPFPPLTLCKPRRSSSSLLRRYSFGNGRDRLWFRIQFGSRLLHSRSLGEKHLWRE